MSTSASPTPASFDPERPLPAPPEPWEGSSMPPSRAAAPFAMTEMIAAEPALAERILERLARRDSSAARLAVDLRAAAEAGAPIVVTGCGTSEHAALGVAEILRDAMHVAGLPTNPGSPVAVQAFEAALAPQASGLLIGVSHEGGTRATNAALLAVRGSGTRTALITAADRSPGALTADVVVATGEMDQSWCHTVGYVSPLLAATAVAGHLTGAPARPADVRRLLAGGAADTGAIEAVAAGLVHARTVLIVGSGADRTTARELVLKLEEGTWIPAAMRDLETFLHGHLPSADDRSRLVLVLTDRDHRAERLARARDVLAAAGAIGLPASAIVSEGVDAELGAGSTPGGRIVVPEIPELPRSVAALLGAATALQLLTERTARAAGTDPDPIRRDDERYRRAAEAAG